MAIMKAEATRSSSIKEVHSCDLGGLRGTNDVLAVGVVREAQAHMHRLDRLALQSHRVNLDGDGGGLDVYLLAELVEVKVRDSGPADRREALSSQHQHVLHATGRESVSRVLRNLTRSILLHGAAGHCFEEASMRADAHILAEPRGGSAGERNVGDGAGVLCAGHGVVLGLGAEGGSCRMIGTPPEKWKVIFDQVS